MKKLITILAVLVLGVSAFALGPNEFRSNTGSDIIHKVLREEKDYEIVLSVDTELYDPDWKATEESVENSIKLLKAIAKTLEWDGWHSCWAVHNTRDPSKSSPTLKWNEMNKCVAAENGLAIDLILNGFVAKQDIEEAEKLLKAGYYVVTLLVVTDGNVEAPGALRMYNNGIWVGIWDY